MNLTALIGVDACALITFLDWASERASGKRLSA
jgi:hypothetical protein